MNSICDDDDFFNIGQVGGLIDATSNGEQFSFSRYDVHSMMDSLDNWSIMNINMCYGDSNLVLDTSIRYNKSIFWICEYLKRNIIKVIDMCFNAFVTLSICRMKGKTAKKISISLSPEVNFLLKRSKDGKISLNLLSISTTGPLTFKHCFGVSFSSNNW